MGSPQWFKTMCAALRDEFNEIANILERTDLVSTIVVTGGGALARIGGVVAFGAALATPFTAGLSAGLFVLGGMAAATGGVAVMGSLTVKHFMEKNKLGHVEKRWSTFSERCKSMRAEFKAGNPLSPKLESLLSHICSDGTEAFTSPTELIDFLRDMEAATTGAEAGSATGARASTASRAVNRSVDGYVALTVGLVGISLEDIIHAIFAFKPNKENKQEPLKAGAVVRILAASLDQLANLE